MTKDWNARTRLVHDGSRRSQYGEMAEAIFLTQGFVSERNIWSLYCLLEAASAQAHSRRRLSRLRVAAKLLLRQRL